MSVQEYSCPQPRHKWWRRRQYSSSRQILCRSICSLIRWSPERVFVEYISIDQLISKLLIGHRGAVEIKISVLSGRCSAQVKRPTGINDKRLAPVSCSFFNAWWIPGGTTIERERERVQSSQKSRFLVESRVETMLRWGSSFDDVEWMDGSGKQSTTNHMSSAGLHVKGNCVRFFCTIQYPSVPLTWRKEVDLQTEIKSISYLCKVLPPLRLQRYSRLIILPLQVQLQVDYHSKCVRVE